MGIITKNTLVAIFASGILSLVINLFTYDFDKVIILAYIDVIIGLIAGVVFLVFLFIPRIRKQYLHIPFAVGLSSIVFLAILIPEMGVKRNAYRVAKRKAKQVAQDNNLKIIEFVEYEPGFFYAGAKKTVFDKNDAYRYMNMAPDSVALYLEVSGRWNENCILESTKNMDVVLPWKKIMLLQKGGCFRESNKNDNITDQKINAANFQGFLNYLRSAYVSEFPFIDYMPDSFDDENYKSLSLFFHSVNKTTFHDPYVLFVMDGNLEKHVTIKTKCTVSNRGVVKDFSSLDDVMIYCVVNGMARVFFFPQEIFDDEWFIDYLLSLDLFWEWYSKPRYEHYLDYVALIPSIEGRLEGIRQSSNTAKEQKEELVGIIYDQYFEMVTRFGLLGLLEK